MTAPISETPLQAQSAGFSGLRVISFESRMAHEMESLILRHGGQPFSAPSMREIPFEANPEALEFARKVMDGKVEVVVLMTGVGTRFLVRGIESRYPKEDFLKALSKTVVIARGPKPVRALAEMGLKPNHIVPAPNTWREVLAEIDKGIPVKDKKVFIQEYGIPNREFLQELKKRGAHASRVPVYRWALPEDLGPLRKAVQEVADGRADVLLFTNATQIHHMLEAASESGLESSLREAMGRVVVASVGPVVTENLKDVGLPMDFEATQSKMGIFVKEISEKAPALLQVKRQAYEKSAGAVKVRPYAAKPYDDAACRDSALLKACRREPVPYTPIWLMRQAGRYMKEYRDVRSRVGFIDLCKNSDLACEVTVTAQERLGVDAAILFSDILLILEAMGAGLEYTKGDGPVLYRPARTREDIEALREVEPKESLGFVYDAVRKIRSALKKDVPLIGFAGAPFTVVSYLVEGRGGSNYLHTKSLMYKEPALWDQLMGKVTDATVRYLNGQIEAGCQAVQLFDSWAGCLSPADYRAFVLPHARKLFAGLKKKVPAIHFATGNPALLPLLKEAGGSVIGLDWRVELNDAWDQLGETAVQGNLDPLALLSDTKSIKDQAARILKQAKGRNGHIFNLGHGVLPQTPVDNAIALVDAVHELSRK